MNYTGNILLLCLIFSSSLTAMEGDIPLTPVYTKKSNKTEETTTTTTLSIKELADTVDNQIKQQYVQHSFIPIFNVLQLQETDMVTIFTITSQTCNDKEKVEPLSTQLYESNAFFRKSVDYFTQKALQNINNVTCNNILTIEDPTLPQPENALNLLPLLFKRYVMNRAKNQVNSSYTMKLVGHTGNIICFDIHIPTGRAVTASYDNTVRLWNLNDGGVCIHTFQQEIHPHVICFNKTSSQIAAGHNFNKNIDGKRHVIKQWKIDQTNLIETHVYEKKGDHIHHISYHNDNNLIAITGHFDSDPTYDKTIINISFEDNACASSTELTTMRLYKPVQIGRPGGDHFENFDKEPYRAAIDIANTLSITKNCYCLYLCQKAINNTQHSSSLGKVFPLYNQLTKYEQGMIQQDIQRRTAELKAIEQQKEHRK